MYVTRPNARDGTMELCAARSKAHADTPELCAARLKAWYIPALWQRLGVKTDRQRLEATVPHRLRIGYAIRQQLRNDGDAVTNGKAYFLRHFLPNARFVVGFWAFVSSKKWFFNTLRF
jgi:hypothetical protein